MLPRPKYNTEPRFWAAAKNERNGLQEIIDDTIAAMAVESGVDALDPSEVNLAGLCRRTGLTRSRARTLRRKGFRVTPHGRCGMKAAVTVLTGFTDTLDGLLREGVTNSSVLLDRIHEQGYEGGLKHIQGIRSYWACGLSPSLLSPKPPARNGVQGHVAHPFLLAVAG